MTKPNDFALIIGVHAYRAYDATGGSDVAGALNDAAAWARHCLSMGFSPERIRVLTTPVLSAEDLGPLGASIYRGEATHEGIVDGLGWLMKALGGEALGSGLMTFSGHADASDGRLLLCPSDTTSSLDNVIDMAALRETLGGGEAAKNLTALIDGCHAQVGLSRGQSLRAALQAKAAGVSVPEKAGVTERVISASRRDQTSSSSHFGGGRMGAFTWAMIAALSQWKVVRENGVCRSTVSYGELLSRARALLSALSFDQEPVLSGPPGVAELAFLHPGQNAAAGETSPSPNGRRPHRQLDAGTKGYRIYRFDWKDTHGTTGTLAQVLVPNTTNGDWLAGLEYWFVTPSVAANLNSALQNQAIQGTAVKVTLATDAEWGASTPSIPSGTRQEITQAAADWSSLGKYAKNVFANGNGLGLLFHFASTGGDVVISQIDWLNPNEDDWGFNDESTVNTTITLDGMSTSTSTFAYQYECGFSVLSS